MRELHLGVALGLATASAKLQDKAVLEGVDQAIARSLGEVGHG